MKKILFLVLFTIFFINNTHAFSFRKKIKNEIILEYSDKNIESKFVLNNYFKKNKNYYICGTLEYIIKESYINKSSKKCLNSNDYCANKDFILLQNNNVYNIYIDSVASVIKPWKSFSKEDVYKNNNIKICFVINNMNFKINDLRRNDVKVDFKNN